MEYYDIYGNALSAVYDIHGNRMSAKPSSAVTNLPYQINSTAWFDYAAPQLAAMREKYYATDERSVPLFICTDEHGSGGMDSHRWFSNNNDVCAVDLQLGDVCYDYYTESYLENMKTRAMPVTNYIGIPGNHDVKQVTDVPTQAKIREYFAWSNGFRYRVIDVDDNASYVVYDDVHGIKFIALDWYTKIGENSNGTMPSPHATSDVMAWVLTELAKNDGYDVIVLQHEPVSGVYTWADGTTEDCPSDRASKYAFWLALKDRKNKRSGTCVDDDGVSHTYDFTGCTSEIICVLHGHYHRQMYLREDGLTAIAFPSWWSVSYAVIDRTNRKFHLWTNTYDSASEEYVYEL